MDIHQSIYEVLQLITNAKGKGKLKLIYEFSSVMSEEQLGTFQNVVTTTYKQGNAFYVTDIETLPMECSLFDEPLGIAIYPDATLDTAIHFLYTLMANGSANAADKTKLAEIHASLDGDDAKVLELIVRRDLKCGASLSTFRKAWGNDFAPDFPKMLCESYNLKKIVKNINFPAISQLKSDGARAMIDTTSKRAVSRNGSDYLNVTHVIDECIRLYGSEYIVDGEFVMVDEDGDIMDRATGNGLLNKSIKGSSEFAIVSQQVRFVVWDLIPRDVFYGNVESTTGYSERLEELLCPLEPVTDDVVYLMPTPSVEVANVAEAIVDYKARVALGEEGTILKDVDGRWEDGRSKTQYKFKEELEADFKIVGWYKGKKNGKYAAAIGGFEFESACGKVAGRCGGGLSDEIRFSDPEQYMDCCIEMKYNARTQSKGSDVWALSHGRCIEIRLDKAGHEADSLEVIELKEAATRELLSKQFS